MRTEYTKMVTKNEKEKQKERRKKPETTCKRTRCVAGVLVEQVFRQTNHWTLKNFHIHNIFYG